ncbi:hypothetical protein [Salinarimonas chemoclinalis]|uniref:hypothetical protein n=1 Tax=Salinarimonas chemoclinalis TaxID=3241599 RepID=UPI003559066C
MASQTAITAETNAHAWLRDFLAGRSLYEVERVKEFAEREFPRPLAETTPLERMTAFVRKLESASLALEAQAAVVNALLEEALSSEDWQAFTIRDALPDVVEGVNVHVLVPSLEDALRYAVQHMNELAAAMQSGFDDHFDGEPPQPRAASTEPRSG